MDPSANHTDSENDGDKNISHPPEMLHSLSAAESWYDSSFQDSVRSSASARNREGHHEKSACRNETLSKDDDGRIATLAKHKLHAFKTSTDILFHSGREENKRMKAVLGAVAGLVIGCVLYGLLVESFGYTPLQAGIITAVSTVILCISLALSVACRCVLVLVLPNFFTGKGRAVFLSVLFGVMLAGPVSNIAYNAKETGSSMACVLDIVSKQTKSLTQTLNEAAEKVARNVNEQRERLNKIKDSVGPDFDIIINEWKRIKNDLQPVTAALTKFYEECRSPVASAVSACTNFCEKLPLFGKEGCLSQCSKLNSLSDFCKPFSINEQIDEATSRTSRAIQDIGQYFKADVKLEGEFNTKTNSSKSVKTIQDEVDSDIEAGVKGFQTCWTVIRKTVSLSLLLLFLQAFWYFRNYMSKDGYDNMYITKDFKELDKAKEVKGEGAVLPLKNKEKGDYIFTLSPKLNRKELGYSKFGLVQVLLHALLCCVLVFIDYALHYILNLVNKFANFELDVSGGARLKFSVTGNGPIAQFYKDLFSFDLDSHFLSAIKIEGCLPKPKHPDGKYISIFIVLYLLAIAVVILRGYGMRLRRKIAAYYYPEQEASRLEYLHKTIRHRRNAQRRFLRQEVKSAHKESEMKEKFRLSTWMVSKCPRMANCMPARKALECTSCGEHEGSFHHVQLTKCTGTRDGVICTAVYCEDCKASLEYVCPLCSSEDVVLRE